MKKVLFVCMAVLALCACKKVEVTGNRVKVDFSVPEKYTYLTVQDGIKAEMDANDPDRHYFIVDETMKSVPEAHEDILGNLILRQVNMSTVYVGKNGKSVDIEAFLPWFTGFGGVTLTGMGSVFVARNGSFHMLKCRASSLGQSIGLENEPVAVNSELDLDLSGYAKVYVRFADNNVTPTLRGTIKGNSEVHIWGNRNFKDSNLVKEESAQVILH